MVKIVADTTSGLPREMLKTIGIPLIPQIVCFGEDSFRDDTELDTAGFLLKLKASTECPQLLRRLRRFTTRFSNRRSKTTKM